MPRHMESADAQCPFYREETGKAVYCEGVTADSRIKQEFAHGAARYKREYCCDRWKNCRVAKMLWEMYE